MLLKLTHSLSQFWYQVTELVEFSRAQARQHGRSRLASKRQKDSRRFEETHAGTERANATASNGDSAPGTGEQRPFDELRSQQTGAVRLGFYESLPELRGLLQTIDLNQNLRLPTVVLMLASNFAGHLPSLIARTSRANRLVLVVENGRIPLPGRVTLGDLAAREGALGWRQIAFERDVEAAICDSFRTLETNEPLIVLWPSWTDCTVPRHLLQNCIQEQEVEGVVAAGSSE